MMAPTPSRRLSNSFDVRSRRFVSPSPPRYDEVEAHLHFLLRVIISPASHTLPSSSVCRSMPTKPSSSGYSPTGAGSIAPPGYSMNDDVDMIDYGGSINGGGSRYCESPVSIGGSVARSRRGSSYQVCDHAAHIASPREPSCLANMLISCKLLGLIRLQHTSHACRMCSILIDCSPSTVLTSIF